MDKKLKAARDKVNALQFGTQEWEDAMVVVRALVEQVNAAMPKAEYRSIDGDIFSC